MPKARGSSSRLAHSHRTTSSGSSKVGLNTLALTQKDPPQPKQQQQNLKRAVHSSTDLHQNRQHLRPAHLTSNSRVRSKDQIVPAQRRNQAPPPNKGRQQQMQAEQQYRQAHRPNFSIARSDDTTDSDDEWVSSESGAATPQVNDYHDNRASEDGEDNLNDYDNGTGTTLVEQQIDNKINGNGNNIYGNTDRQTLAVTNGHENVTTPRAEVELDLPRVETARPLDVKASLSSRAQPQEQYEDHQQEMKKTEPPPIVRVQPQSTPASPALPTSPAPGQQVDEIDITPMRHAHSEAPSPTQLRQKGAAASGSRRTTLIRHSSTSHGDKKREMPPHPLIRGQSYHGAAGSVLRPAVARLAPLTLNPEVAKAQLTASPSSAVTPGRTESPSFSYSFAKTPSDASTEDQDRFPSRRGSVSSLHSIATLPAPASGRFTRAGKQDQHPNRTRTLSTLSTSSSSAALAALSTLPSISRPSSPPLVVRFPAERNDRDPHDGIHTLLPPTYFAAHMPVLSKYNPLYDSWERVMRAKRGQGR